LSTYVKTSCMWTHNNMVVTYRCAGKATALTLGFTHTGTYLRCTSPTTHRPIFIATQRKKRWCCPPNFLFYGRRGLFTRMQNARDAKIVRTSQMSVGRHFTLLYPHLHRNNTSAAVKILKFCTSKLILMSVLQNAACKNTCSSLNCTVHGSLVSKSTGMNIPLFKITFFHPHTTSWRVGDNL
jgi:hypothetical protein